MNFTILKDRPNGHENRCSVIPLIGRPDISIVYRPDFDTTDFSGMTLLHPEGEVRTIRSDERILLVDSNWTMAKRLYNRLATKYPTMKRVAFHNVESAYPWKGSTCPSNSLASVEALYLASLLMGRSDESLLAHYYFREQFLEKLRRNGT